MGCGNCRGCNGFGGGCLPGWNCTACHRRRSTRSVGPGLRLVPEGDGKHSAEARVGVSRKRPNQIVF